MLTACSHAATTLVPEPSLPAHDEPRELAVDQQAKHALERLTYGARSGEAALVTREGLDRWLVRQLTPENWPDRGADSALANVPVTTMSIKALVDSSPPQDVFIRRRRVELGLAANAPYTMTTGDSARFKIMSNLGNRRVQEILGAKMARAVMSDHQLLEVMTDFWENHFSVFRGKMPTQFTLLEYDRDVIRPRALGKFRDLLGAVAHSAAMLYYLDNYQSSADSAHLTLTAWRNLAKARNAADSARIRANASRRRGGLNENYGRELMELHTMGVDGGYTQTDVINVARALTGWTLQTPREGGGFRFDSATHDAGSKLVLGHVLPAGRAEEDGEEVLDIVARHPSTALFIATKLVRHFVSDTPPPALVRRAAATFTRTDGDIRQVLALIVASPEFYAKAAMRSKVKTPYELVASTYRVMQGRPDTAGRSVQLAATLGQPLYGHLTPEGWPDDAEAWMNTGAVLSRINFGSNVAAGRVIGIVAGKWAPPAWAPGASLEQQVDAISAALLQGEMSADTHRVLISGSNPLAARAGMGAAPAGRLPTLIELLGLALGAPEFQRR
ncbi:MAG: DUF1800 domain-containing protein [Gemmatimonadota bacterium]|nr:DUF1800 domain-containing protein [Gemmatimonadota bacterium]